MYKPKLENIIKKASEVYIQQGDILVTAEGFYIDQRTMQDSETKQWIIKPIAYMNRHYWYVCPDCQEIHCTNESGLTEMQTGCCMSDDSLRHQYFHDKHFLIKRNAIILDDGC